MMDSKEKKEEDKLYLLKKSRLNSLGSFLKILQYLDKKKSLKKLMYQLHRNGKHLYLEYIQNSVDFSEGLRPH